MKREYIRASPSWRGGEPRFDCVLLKSQAGAFEIARILLFFIAHSHFEPYSCAFIQRYELVHDLPDPDTGMWIVQPRTDPSSLSVISVHSIIRAAHLIPVFPGRVPRSLKHHHSLDAFDEFYVNKYADHSAFDLLF